MRMKFEAEAPSEVTKSGSDGVDRSQGAARAISVWFISYFSCLVNQSLDKSFIDPGLKWSDLDWFKSITNSTFMNFAHTHCYSVVYMYISASNTERCSKMGGQQTEVLLGWYFLKWLQDALRAYDLGLAGVVLSNHGGRQLDFARSSIEVLVEVVVHLKEKRGLSFPNEKFQLFVDGGVRRATDVIKAIALGATAGNVSISVSFSQTW